MKMQSVLKINDFLNRVSLVIAGIMIFVMMILIVLDVIWRYFFNDPSVWVLDITRFLLCYVVFLGLSPALKDGNHVAVDLFIDRFGPKAKRWLELAALILVVLFACILLKTLGSETLKAFSDNRLSPTTVPVPLKWIYIIGPVGMLTFLLTAVMQLVVYVCNWGNDDKKIEFS